MFPAACCPAANWLGAGFVFPFRRVSKSRATLATAIQSVERQICHSYAGASRRNAEHHCHCLPRAARKFSPHRAADDAAVRGSPEKCLKQLILRVSFRAAVEGTRCQSHNRTGGSEKLREAESYMPRPKLTPEERRERARLRSERWRRAHGIGPRKPAQRPWLAAGARKPASRPRWRTLRRCSTGCSGRWRNCGRISTDSRRPMRLWRRSCPFLNVSRPQFRLAHKLISRKGGKPRWPAQ
jgi:hypothetical protein